jgi:hypothetical protein
VSMLSQLTSVPSHSVWDKVWTQAATHVMVGCCCVEYQLP